MNSNDNLNKIFKSGQIDFNFPMEFFYSVDNGSNDDNELYFTTDNNLSSPKFRVYKINLDRNHSFIVTRVKKFKMDIDLKNKLVKCTEDKFQSYIDNFKMMLELRK